MYCHRRSALAVAGLSILACFGYISIKIMLKMNRERKKGETLAF